MATLLGIALVVAVFVLLRSLAAGIEKSSAQTGDPRNILVVRKGSQAESSSLVTREQLQALQYLKFSKAFQLKMGCTLLVYANSLRNQ